MTSVGQRDLAEALAHVRARLEHREEGSQRRLVVGRLVGVGVGDVATDGVDDVDAALEHRGQALGQLGRRLHRCVDHDDAGQLGVGLGQGEREGAAHRQAGDDDAARRARGPGARRGERSASASQSCQVVRARSAGAVPCPGSRGSSTAKPASANTSASGRMDTGLPVKPWSTSAPWGPPPGEDHGSQPGSTGC